MSRNLISGNNREPGRTSAEFRHKFLGKMQHARKHPLHHCEEAFAPEALVILGPPSGHGEMICARCIEIMLRRAIANLPRDKLIHFTNHIL
jgi:hypothetical protein